jgi:hypothetical protein
VRADTLGSEYDQPRHDAHHKRIVRSVSELAALVAQKLETLDHAVELPQIDVAAVHEALSISLSGLVIRTN